MRDAILHGLHCTILTAKHMEGKTGAAADEARGFLRDRLARYHAILWARYGVTVKA